MNTVLDFRKFEHRAPSAQNAVDIFQGRWACDLADVCPGVKAGPNLFFTTDRRPRMLADVFGTGSRLDNMSVLELGPLEGHHTFQLENLGANRILAIESNTEAFLKCLVVKEILNLRIARFVLGDFNEYLRDTTDIYDVVMCSGVLYHNSDPINLIQQIARVTQKCFVWTHYFEEDFYTGPTMELRTDPRYPGVKMYVSSYGNIEDGRFWGGNKPIYTWLSREDMLMAFKNAGFTHIQVIEDTRNEANIASLTFAARREQ